MKSTQLAHSLISDKLCGGEVVIDATAGNGNDALFLANLEVPRKVATLDAHIWAWNNIFLPKSAATWQKCQSSWQFSFC